MADVHPVLALVRRPRAVLPGSQRSASSSHGGPSTGWPEYPTTWGFGTRPTGVRPSDLETIYSNMPATGLGKAVGSVPVARGRDSAAARMGLRADQLLPETQS